MQVLKTLVCLFQDTYAQVSEQDFHRAGIYAEPSW
jgi:hypothetical protein